MSEQSEAPSPDPLGNPWKIPRDRMGIKRVLAECDFNPKKDKDSDRHKIFVGGDEVGGITIAEAGEYSDASVKYDPENPRQVEGAFALSKFYDFNDVSYTKNMEPAEAAERVIAFATSLSDRLTAK